MPVLKIRKDDGTWQEVWGGLTDTPIGGITEQVQADWNEADTTSPAYIKNKPDISGNTDVYWEDIYNKPFGETSTEVDIVPMERFTDFSLDSTFNLYIHGIPGGSPLTVGQSYNVSWDGVEYVCEALDVSQMYGGLPMVAFGNGTAFGYPGNNEPFIILCNNGNGYITLACLTHTEPCNHHDVRVYTKTVTIQKIDPKYLPDDIGGSTGPALPEVSTADAGKFLRVSADGTWVVESIPNAEGASF